MNEITTQTRQTPWAWSASRVSDVTELLFEDPCVVFALGRESRHFRREFRPHQRFPGAPCWARFCGPPWLTVLALETGVGRERTERVLDWLLQRPLLGNVHYRPKLILSAGFAGAVHPDHRVGDVILATEVSDLEGRRWPTTWPGELRGQWWPPLHRGRLLTAADFTATAEQKLALGRNHQALAVDMESAVVAERCSKADIPFGCVRSISDDAHTALSPRLANLLAAGRASPLRVLTNLIRSPRLGSELWRLARDTRLAAEQLGRALGELLTLTLPFGADLDEG